jgi:hypothetical protein
MKEETEVGRGLSETNAALMGYWCEVMMTMIDECVAASEGLLAIG